MKNLIRIIALLTLPLYSVMVNGQEVSDDQKVWATFNDLTILPETTQGKLISSSPELQEIINTYNIIACEQILPDSRKDELLRVYELSCDCDQNDLINALNSQELATVTRAEAAPVYELLYTPDDYNLVFMEDYALDLIGAQEAWEYTMGDPSVEIAISDSNFDLDHQEINGTTTHIQSPLTHPNVYHGTAVAITAAGNTDNAVGKSSIGGNCMLQLYSMSYSNFLTATYSGAKVINVSWTSGCTYSSYYQAIVDEVYENGTIIVAAAGNGGTCGGPEAYVYPASLDHVLSVTSIGPMDNHERIPGDPTSTHQHNDSVDVCAPGYDIALSVVDGWYLTGNGTSFAAPIVSGTIGLMFSVNPCLTFEDVEFILDSTSANIDMLNPDYAGKLGAGQIHASKAVEMAAEYGTFDFHLTAHHGCTPTSGIAVVVPVPGEAEMPFSLEWNTGDTTMMVENLEAGIYDVKVTDKEGCFSWKEEEVTTSEEIMYADMVTHVTCNGDETGTVNVEMLGGVEPYSYEWSHGPETEDVYELPAGGYWLTITDDAGCSKSKYYSIEEPEALELSFDVTDVYEAFASSEVDLTVTGGTAPYNFEWSNSEMTEDLVELDGGAYDVLVTDANGCEASGSVQVSGPTAGVGIYEVEEVSIYPNPSQNGNATLTWNGDVQQIMVTNAAGQIVENHIALTGQDQLELNNLSQGMYMISLMNGNEIISIKKLVVL